MQTLNDQNVTVTLNRGQIVKFAANTKARTGEVLSGYGVLKGLRGSDEILVAQGNARHSLHAADVVVIDGAISLYRGLPFYGA